MSESVTFSLDINIKAPFTLPLRPRIDDDLMDVLVFDFSRLLMSIEESIQTVLSRISASRSYITFLYGKLDMVSFESRISGTTNYAGSWSFFNNVNSKKMAVENEIRRGEMSYENLKIEYENLLAKKSIICKLNTYFVRHFDLIKIDHNFLKYDMMVDALTSIEHTPAYSIDQHPFYNKDIHLY